MAPPPKKQMRWGRVFGVLIVLGGIIAGMIVLLTK
ncbi:hypothetical protein BH11MYX3_BH11MYX3_25980 [soil metagenome]